MAFWPLFPKTGEVGQGRDPILIDVLGTDLGKDAK